MTGLPLELAHTFVTARDEPKRKANYIGAPACFQLELCCQELKRAFGGLGLYQVGSSLERPDWRDIDVRYIMRDEEFSALFPNAGDNWEMDPRWVIMCVSISAWLSKQTGLPVDFQFQGMTHANKVHDSKRNALGLIFAPKVDL